MDELLTEKQEDAAHDIQSMMKSGDAFRFISPLERSKAYETEEDGEKKKYVELYASSDQDDLVGDCMTVSALEDMEASAVGTIMLRDHNPSTEKIFGSIVEARLEQKDGMTLLWIKALVDDGDNQNIRLWKSIKNGTKLGASVTVIVLKKAANPRRKGGLIIQNVQLLEISIVTIPCNQQSWTLAATASKALRKAERALSKSQINKEGETEMKEQTENKSAETAAVQTETEEAPVENTAEATAEIGEAENKSAFPRSTAAIAATVAARKAHEENGTLPAVVEINVKGMFADELAKRKPSLWDLFDILCTVKWQLMDRKWAIEWTDLEDDFDYVGAFRTACEEFAAAAVESFAYYGGFSTESSDDASKSAETTPENLVSTALEIEKAFKTLAELIEKSAPEAQKDLRSVASSMLELAKQAGVPFPETQEAQAANEAAASPEPAEEQIRKSPVFTEVLTRAETAESELEKAKKDLEIAKAGLETANAVLQSVARQPLVVGSKAQASS